MVVVFVATTLRLGAFPQTAAVAAAPPPASASPTDPTGPADPGETSGRAHPIDGVDSALTQWAGLEGVVHLEAYRRAYPDRIHDVSFRDGDWAVLVHDTWFYWANGRLLPEKARRSWDLYAPMRLYRYQTGPYRVPTVAADREEALLTWIDRDPRTTARRHNGFYGVLYGALSSGQARSVMETVTFLGHRVRVHPLLVEPLRRVQEDLERVMTEEPELRRFVNTIALIDGQNWRHVAGTRSLSLHSYGVAIDIIPTSYQRTFSYWRWAAQAGITRWWELPIRDRWLLPDRMVKIFEHHGFVWGGRWLFFDSIHLEYRPEIFEMNRLAASPSATFSPRSSP